MVSANMEVPVRGTANFLPFQGGAQRLLREDGRDRWVALIPPPFSKRWAGVFGHRPFALPAFGHAPVRVSTRRLQSNMLRIIYSFMRAYRNFCGVLDWFSLSVGGVGVSRGGVEFVPVDAGPVCGRDAVVRFGRRCLFALPQGVGDE